VGCLSRAEGMRLSVRDELRSHTPHAIPLILPARFGLLHACVETLQAYLRACCRSWSHTSMLPNTHKSLVRRMMATLINCVAEKTNAHSNYIRSVAFSPDGTKIVSGSNDRTIKVWDSSGAPRAQNRPSWPKLMPVGLSIRPAGADEREDARPQRLRHVGGVLPGRDQDFLGIARRDDQSLGFGCATSSKSPLLGQN